LENGATGLRRVGDGVQERVEDAGGQAEPQVPDHELGDVVPAVVAVEHAGRRDQVGNVGVQVGPGAHDDPAEKAVDRAGEQTPPGQVVVVRGGLEEGGVQQHACGPARVAWPAQPASRR